VRDADAPGPLASLPLRAVWAVLARPRLWGVAVRQALGLARPGWWRSPPFLPLPDAGYLRFRLETAYGPGATSAALDAADLVDYLEWCRARRRLAAERVA